MAKSTTPPSLIHKALGVEGCKVLDEEHGIVEAYVSGIGNKDAGGDIIIPGAFDQSLSVRKPKGVWSHDWDKPVSKTLEIYEVPANDPRLPLKMQLAGIGGLYVKTQFNLKTQIGRDAFENVKFFGDESEWSIGYEVAEEEFDDKSNAMILKAIDLYEYSPVLFGMNALTSTVSIKAHLDGNEYDIDVEGLGEIESKAVKAALKVILEEKAVSLKSDSKITVDTDSVESDSIGSEKTEEDEVEEKSADEDMSEKPWHVEKRDDEYCVIKDDDGSVAGCHETRESAENQIAALYASEGDKSDDLDSEEKEAEVDEKALVGNVRSAIQSAAGERWGDAWVADFDQDENIAYIETFNWDDDDYSYEEWKVGYTVDANGFVTLADDAVAVTSRTERVYAELSAESGMEEKSQEAIEESSVKSDDGEPTVQETIDQYSSVIEKLIERLGTVLGLAEVDSEEKDVDEGAEEKEVEESEEKSEESEGDPEEKSEEESEVEESEEKVSPETDDEKSEESEEEKSDTDDESDEKSEEEDVEDKDDSDKLEDSKEDDSEETSDEKVESSDEEDAKFLANLAEFEALDL